MLVLDQVKKGDFRLRCLAAGICLGMLILLAGLWHVQILSRHKYETSLEVQSFRTVRLPAARGRLLDRNGQVLADNHPRYDINLYLEDIREQFKFEYTNNVKRAFIQANGRRPKSSEMRELEKAARYNVVSNIVWRVSSAVLPQPLVLNPYAFHRHYMEKRAMPMPVATDLSYEQIARFMEQVVDIPGIELEVEAVRNYPHGTLAAHALGFVQKERNFEKDEAAGLEFSYRLPDYEGMTGLEAGFEQDLRGFAGARRILVNNVGYRVKEETWLTPEPGNNVILTLDLELQRAAEKALLSSGPDTRGAAVVLNCQTGDILALASTPAYDPNMFVRPRDYSEAEWQRLQDPVLTPQYNRALQGAYPPGSIFKIVVALAGFQAGVMDLDDTVYNPGYYQVGRRRIKDENAPVGEWAFIEAFKRSANTYFIEMGMRTGPEPIIEMGRRLGIGDKTGAVQPGLESDGYLPTVAPLTKKDGSRWMDGDTANLCIGQGEILVTPMQMALLTAAVANGGTVFRPRLVMQLEEQDPSGRVEEIPAAQVERKVSLNPVHLDWVRRGMLADVQEKHGTGQPAYIPGMGICGKTGTAQIYTAKGRDRVTWFVSYAPFEAPKYVVVVMVESGAAGGLTCAPKAREIYRAIQKLEQGQARRNIAAR